MCEWKSSDYKDFKCDFDKKESLLNCIFHKKSKTHEELKLMKSYFDNEKNKKWYLYFLKVENGNKVIDFRGFCFEEKYKFDFSDIVDSDIIYDFSEAIFFEDVQFDNQIFNGEIYFDNTIFEKNVSFKDSVFNNNVVFYNSKFKTKSEKLTFLGSKFKGQNFIFENCIDVPKIDGINFSENTKFMLDKIEFLKNDNITAKTYYRIARNQATKTGDYENIGRYYYMERYYNTKLISASKYKTKREYFFNKSFDLMSKYVTGYGEKPLNIFLISFLLVSFFALMYMLIGIKSIQNESIHINLYKLSSYSLVDIVNAYLKSWYFSIVTFATVGYGDIIVINVYGRILVVLEIFFGLTMAACWATTLIKKMAR